MSTHPAHNDHHSHHRRHHDTDSSHSRHGHAPPVYPSPADAGPPSTHHLHEVTSAPPVLRPQPQVPVMMPAHGAPPHPAAYPPQMPAQPGTSVGSTGPVGPPPHHHSQVQNQIPATAASRHEPVLSPVSSRPPAAYQSAYQPPANYVPSKVLPPPELPNPTRTETAPAKVQPSKPPEQRSHDDQKKKDKKKKKDEKEEDDQSYDDFIELGLEFVGKMARTL